MKKEAESKRSETLPSIANPRPPDFETARLRNRRQIIAMPVGLKAASGRIRNKGRRRGPDKRTGSKRKTASCVGRVAPFRRLERLRVILQGWRANGLHLSLDNVHLPSFLPWFRNLALSFPLFWSPPLDRFPFPFSSCPFHFSTFPFPPNLPNLLHPTSALLGLQS